MTEGTRPYFKAVAVSILGLVLVLNQMDRALLSVLAEPIRKDLDLTDTQLGILSGLGFAVVYAIMGIPLAYIADRGDRPRLLAACLTVWTIITSLMGLVATFGQLLFARMLLAVGESGCQPAQHSLLADYIPEEQRARVLGVIAVLGSGGAMLALPVGGILESILGWRGTMVAVGLIGLPVAALTWSMLPESRRAGSFTVSTSVTLRETFSYLAHSRVYITLVLAAMACPLPILAVHAWAPAFFMRTHQMSAREVGLGLGLVSLVGSLVGHLLAGWIADFVLRYHRKWVMIVPCIAMILTGPLYSLAFLAQESSTALGLYLLPTVLSIMYYAPIYSSIQSTTPPSMRAQAAAICLAANGVVGVGLGPTATGVLSDIFKAATGTDSLRWALVCMANLTLVAAACCALASYVAARSPSK